jgi:hypothetical protein
MLISIQTVIFKLFQLLIHTFKVMAQCADESNFHSYYPEESKSFCGRALKEELADGFISNVQSSPTRIIRAKTSQWPQLDRQFDWRQPQVPPPPGFEPQATLVSTQKTGVRKRPRRRKPKLTDLPLDESINEKEQDDEDNLDE